MAIQFNMSDSKGSKIIYDDDGVKFFDRSKLLYDGPYKDVHIIGITEGIFSSGGKISFGFPGKIFRMDFYPKSKQDSLHLKEVFSDKVVKHKQSEEHFKIKEMAEKQERQAEKEKKALIREQTEYYKNMVKCPRCHSTSIDYQGKISYGRAAVGGLLAGHTGAVIGGLTGKKGYAVCLNCGKRWKI